MPPVNAPDRPARTEGPTSSVSLRIPHGARELIDTAAAAVGKSRTEFMVESARQRAIDVLLDQRLFVLAPEQYDAFMKTLETPAPPNAQLKRLMANRSPWES